MDPDPDPTPGRWNVADPDPQHWPDFSMQGISQSVIYYI